MLCLSAQILFCYSSILCRHYVADQSKSEQPETATSMIPSAIAVKASCPLSAVVYIARRCIKTGYKPRGVSSKVKRLVSWFLSTKQHAVSVFSSTTSLSPRSIKNLSDHPKAELQRSSPSSGFISNLIWGTNEMGFIMEFAENLVLRLMEDPEVRDRKAREHIYEMHERCKKIKEMWALPIRPYGFWTFERHNAQLRWDPQISQTDRTVNEDVL
ncbi:Uncharacterized protein Rs2_04463 [Raphanus sativus]|nr:Uncharacterized protein Rs2_04463 [Raphanus sativus]